MIALFAEKQHAAEFDCRFRKLFTDLTRFARSHGIDGYYALGGSSNSEDPEEFAQECLIEYSNRARRDGFRKVQTGLIKRIAHNRLVDAWRKRYRSRKRDEFQVFTNRTSRTR